MTHGRTFELAWRAPAPGTEAEADGTWRLRWRGTAVMGIVNVTPDSFSDGGVHQGVDEAVRAARVMAEAGATFVDVGGESTRPGAEPTPPDEERRRVLPVVEALAAWGGIPVSVDTRRPAVAREALSAGAHLINDVGGLQDERMRAVCAAFGAPAVIMHMQGDPRTMQRDPRYDDVVAEVASFLETAAERARADGVPSVLVDPGIGFGKTEAHNLALLGAVERFAASGPVLVGASRKGLVGALGGARRADQRDAGSIALHLHAARRGAAVVRVHDVAGHVQALRVQAALAAGAP